MVRTRASTLDGHLFLVRHLMILKEIVGKLELGEVDADKFEFGSAGVTGSENHCYFPFSI